MNKLWRQSLSRTAFAGYRPQGQGFWNPDTTFAPDQLIDCPAISYDTTTVRVCVQSQPT